MSKSRQILPGRTYLITRRCTQRQFLLRPDEKTNAAFLYCLAEAAARHGILVVAWLAMSNHYHAVLHDPCARLPAFLEHFHKMAAKALNARWGRTENLWATEQTSVVWLPTPQDVFDKVVYTLANPVAADLTEHAMDWPGASALGHLDGKELTVHRPSFFFREDGTMPPVVRLRSARPPELIGEVDGWARSVRAAIADIERDARTRRQRAGIRVVGRRAVRRTSQSARPTKREPQRKLRPTIACRTEERRLAELRKAREFQAAYRFARNRYVDGEHYVVFPAGTYLFRRLGVCCAQYAPG
ncbi:MAG: hypothetical protein HOW73_27575 [Polyangiaceae bacterium]|nr:hypothetical protein [Polyangiaceae bacterium]